MNGEWTVGEEEAPVTYTVSCPTIPQKPDEPTVEGLLAVSYTHLAVYKRQLYDLYQVRHPLYLQACDYHVDNDGTLEDVCHKIIDLLKKL